jgi:hypothetical protein
VFIFSRLDHTGVAGVGKHGVLVAMQHRSRFNDVSNGGCRGREAAHHTTFGIDADMRLHAEVPLVALLRLLHVFIALPTRQR